MSELQKELDKDQAFINEVQERIYCESDDWEDSIAEPEWIMQMTDIADKYLSWFKAAENGRRKVVQDKAKLLEMSKPKLNENQEIVLEWLKRECTDYSPKWGLINELHHILGYSSTSSDELIAIGELSFKEELEVMNRFCTWALDQC